MECATNRLQLWRRHACRQPSGGSLLLEDAKWEGCPSLGTSLRGIQRPSTAAGAMLKWMAVGLSTGRRGSRVSGRGHLERELGICTAPGANLLATEHRDTNMCQDGDGRREEIWTRTRVHRACGQAGADTRRGEAMEAAARAAERDRGLACCVRREYEYSPMCASTNTPQCAHRADRPGCSSKLESKETVEIKSRSSSM